MVFEVAASKALTIAAIAEKLLDIPEHVKIQMSSRDVLFGKNLFEERLQTVELFHFPSKSPVLRGIREEMAKLYVNPDAVVAVNQFYPDPKAKDILYNSS